MNRDDRRSRESALSLFRFLREFALLSQRPVLSCEEYIDVFWLDDLPRVPECFCAAWLEPEAQRAGTADDAWVVIRRPARSEPPAVPLQVQPWVDERLWRDSGRDYPELYQRILNPEWQTDGPAEVSQYLDLDDFPEVRRAWDDYVADEWWPWAEEDQKQGKVQDCYNKLFRMHRTQLVMGEQYEFLLAAGCLHWVTPSENRVKRHLLVLPVTLEFEPEGAQVAVVTGDGTAEVKLETDMLLPEERPPVELTKEVEKGCRELGDNLFHSDAITLLTRWVQGVHPEGTLVKDLGRVAGTAPKKPLVYFAPALIVRRRTQRTLIAACDGIIKELEGGDGALPPAVRKIAGELGVDDHLPKASDSAQGKAADTGDTEIYFPLPYNDEQKRVLARLEQQCGVLVQGPPGTGKSQTIANLICHLLATGQRILVTSQKAPALRVLKRFLDKHAVAVAELCVMVLGEGGEEKLALRKSVGQIAFRHAVWQPELSQQAIARLRGQLNTLRQQEASAYKNLVALREREVMRHDQVFGAYSGTLAVIADRVRRDAEKFAWFEDRPPEERSLLVEEAPALPVDPLRVQELVVLLRTIDSETEKRAARHLVPLEAIPAPEQFRALVAEEAAARAQYQEHVPFLVHPARGGLDRTDEQVLSALLADLRELCRRLQEVGHAGGEWILNALREVSGGRPAVWREVLKTSQRLLSEIADRPARLAEVAVQGLGGRSHRAVLQDACALRDHISRGGKLGFSIFRPKVVKRGLYLLNEITVDNQRCDSRETLEKLMGWLELNEAARRLDEQWAPITGASADQRPLNQRIRVYEQYQALLETVFALAARAEDLERRVRLYCPEVECVWHDQREVAALRDLAAALLNERRLGRASRAVTDVENRLREHEHAPEAAPENRALREAVHARRDKEYHRVYGELARLWDWRRRTEKRVALIREMGKGLPGLVRKLVSSVEDPAWDERLAELPAAWNWVLADCWLAEMSAPGKDTQLAAAVRRYQQEAGRVLAELAGELAWEHCLANLTESDLQSLKAWQKAMERVGKGTGKYAARHRRIAQERLEECRRAVPAWVMPLYKVFDTVSIAPGVFDVAIIDEASQSGLEALVLTYLAKKVVVVGDDQQIRPENVGINYDDVFQLQRHYLADIAKSDIFGPTESFFSVAEVRFGDAVRLREHFRCMPEIIGFSNQLCYQDQPLIPLRQFGRDRLAPVLRAQYVTDGYQTQAGGPNPVEAERIVDKIVACCRDPAYAGKMMGIISLLGTADQDRLIEQLLLQKLSVEEIAARNIVCGDAYDFQGDERDVIFLSLVSAPSENWRIGPLTGDKARRRFNVAVSRARDQVHLFHSVREEDLSPSCVRRELLAYIRNHAVDRAVLPPEVPSLHDLRRLAWEAERTAEKPPRPFDSWFEVDVYLDIAGRGHVVVPQYEVNGYFIDLVIVGGTRKLAVECDGDCWHGPERFEADLYRQRQLERCGWEFFRVRASTYYRDPAAALAPLWEGIGSMEDNPPSDNAPAGKSPAAKPYGPRKPAENSEPQGSDQGKKKGEKENKGKKLPATMDDLLATTNEELGRIICTILRELPNASAKKDDLVTLVCRRFHTITRGSRRNKLKQKINWAVSRLKKDGLVEEYRAKNLRVRLLGPEMSS